MNQIEQIEVDRIMAGIVDRDIDRHILSLRVLAGVQSDIDNPTIEVRRKENERRRTKPSAGSDPH